ncbi:MAG: hypothetical protein Q8Q62_09965 [Mesorhizobium sp.]|nr:hypothetical protein [Mesorhizobium sp.]
MTIHNDIRHGATAWARLLPFTVAVLAFGVMALLYLAAPVALYNAILRGWGIKPFPFVFLDTDTVLSAVRCVRQGVDVFAVNPCDTLGRLFSYSPLWLLMAELPEQMTRLNPSGLIVCAGYFLSLLLLPVGTTRREGWLVAFGAVSTAAVFAVERGNNDLVLFALAAVAATLACRSPGLRLVGYGAALLAGLLKFYPMTLLALATRERPGRFVLVVALVCVATAAFLLAMGEELMRALSIIPTGEWYGTMFGSSTVAGGLGQQFGWPPRLQGGVHVLMCLGALAAGLWLAARPAIRLAMATLDERQQAFLLVGALLTLSCFFTAQNIGYRAIHLLLLLPTALALARIGGSSPVLRWLPRLVLVLLWAEGWRHAIHQLPIADPFTLRLISWALREIAWWMLIPVLIACVAILLARSEIGRRLLPRLARTLDARPAPTVG